MDINNKVILMIKARGHPIFTTENDEVKTDEGENDEGKNEEGKNDEGKNDEGDNDRDRMQFDKCIRQLIGVYRYSGKHTVGSVYYWRRLFRQITLLELKQYFRIKQQAKEMTEETLLSKFMREQFKKVDMTTIDIVISKQFDSLFVWLYGYDKKTNSKVFTMKQMSMIDDVFTKSVKDLVKVKITELTTTGDTFIKFKIDENAMRILESIYENNLQSMPKQINPSMGIKYHIRK